MQSRDAVQRARQLQELRKDYDLRLKGGTEAAHRLIIELFKLPVMTNSIAIQATGFSWQSARDTVKRLEAAGIVRRLDILRREHIYVAPEIISIVDAAEAVPSPTDTRQVEFDLEPPVEVTQSSGT
jgi:hypothetical protein